MSADNYLAIRHKGHKWVVNMGNASTGHEGVWALCKSRDEAIDAAQEILETEVVEYGISVIERIGEKE